MIVGHLAAAALVTRGWRSLSWWWLAPAAIAPDLLDLAYAAAGICNPYGLYSHTLPAAALLAACIGGAAALSGRRATGAASAVLVLAHLPLDFVTGRKLFWPGAEMYGMRLYEWPLLSFAVEAGLLVTGWALLRGQAGIPRLVTDPRTLALLVALQASLNSQKQVKKPTACQGALVSPAAGGL